MYVCRSLLLVKGQWITEDLKEFFRLFAKEASQTYFKGASEKCRFFVRFFVNNVTAVQVNVYGSI